MKQRNVLWLLSLAIACLFAAFSLVGCGGGGGGGGGEPGTLGAGSVAVFVADGPAEDYDHIWIRIKEVSLLPADNSDPVVVFKSKKSEGYKLDLLAYRDEDFFLTVHDVPARDYSKIRLKVGDVQPEGGTGSCTTLQLKLPGNDKIDLNPRGTFSVKDGGYLTIRLDIDADKSIHLVQAGQSGMCIFRPVVFVDIEEGPPAARCPRILAGKISGLIEQGGEVVGFLLEREGLPVRRITLADDAAIFDEDGWPVSAAALALGLEVRVRGKLDQHHRFVASVVVIGETTILEGTVDGEVDPDTDQFDVIPLGQEYPTTVRIFDQTLLLFGCDTQIHDPGLIQPGMIVRVVGKDVNGAFNAIAVLMDMLSGEVTHFDFDIDTGGVLTINENIEVWIPPTSPFYLVGDGQVDPAWLCIGKDVRVSVNPQYQGEYDFQATQVEIRPDEFVGVEPLGPSGIDWAYRTLTVKGEDRTVVATVPEGAAILDLTAAGTPAAVSFDELREGDTVKLIGLYDCSPTDRMTALVVLILSRD